MKIHVPPLTFISSHFLFNAAIKVTKKWEGGEIIFLPVSLTWQEILIDT